MTTQQIIKLKEILTTKGYTEQQADSLIEVLQEAGIANTDPTQQFITTILDNPAIQELVKKFAEKDEKIKALENESDANFHTFLSGINRWQKVYSILLMVVGGSIVYFLGKEQIIGKETSQTLLTLIITLTVTDAISSYLKSSRNDS